MLLTYPDVSSLHNFRQNRHTLNQSGANLYFFPRTLNNQHQTPNLVELSGIEPLTPCLQSRCSPS